MAGCNVTTCHRWARKYSRAHDIFLTFSWISQEESNKVSRYFVTCFNVTQQFAADFKLPKSKGGGEFSIKYLETVFNKEAGSGEFFIEFEEKVWEHKLVERFVSQGAGQVSTITFANNDGGDSAANALARIFLEQEKYGAYTRGHCPPSLLDKAMTKRETIKAAQQKQKPSQEFDEKTAAAIKHSLETSAVKLEHIELGVQSQAAQLSGIQDGVCNVIPDYQKEIAKLKQDLAHKTKLCDRIEGQKGRLTMEINRLNFELGERNDEAEALRLQKHEQSKKIQELLQQLDMCKSIALLKQMQEEAQHTAEILSSTLAEERAAKRVCA